MIPKNDGYNAQRTSMDLPVIQKVIAAVKASTPDQVVLQPTLGGSLPLFLFEKYLKAVTVTVPIANHDNNQHAENENIRLRISLMVWKQWRPDDDEVIFFVHFHKP